jgi:hypothetical protein
MALNEQKVSEKHLGQILAAQGWIEQQTIDYLMAKVVLPERRAGKKQLSYLDKNGSQSLTEVEPTSFTQREASDLPLSAPLRELEFHLSSSKSIRFLLLLVLCLILASLFGQFSWYYLPDYPLRGTFALLFNVDGEQNFPTLYSWSALLLCSILLAIIAYAKKVAGERYVRHWKTLAIIFLYLFLDEALSLHEKTVKPLQAALQTSGFFNFAWVIPGSILVLICLLSFRQFLAHLPVKTRSLFLIAGAIYVGGALGMEMVGGYYADFYGLQNMMFAILTTIEEFLEMLGIVVFIYALLSYINTYMRGVSLKVNIIDAKKQG